MNDRELYYRILGLFEPWTVSDIKLSVADRTVTITIDCARGIPLSCPRCGAACTVYDHVPRTWRHLDTCQLQTVIQASVPRVDCPQHGPLQVEVPWAEPRCRFTALFEGLVISLLRDANVSAVADIVGLTWDAVDGIQQRAVDRGLARRKLKPVRNVAIDETSFQKHHEYVSVVVDRDRGMVVDVMDDRKKESIMAWLESLPDGHLAKIDTVSMDMWQPFIAAFLEEIPHADQKICFDRFHVASHLGKAVDLVRGAEHRALQAEHGESPLTGTKHDWLRNADRIDNRTRSWFMELTRRTLKTARAWAIKEQASKLWKFTSRTWAEKGWRHLLAWMDRCRLGPVRKVARMIKAHLWGIINAIVLGVTNAISESINAKVQKIKSMACGFRNRARFRRAIMFHLGGLDLMPRKVTFPAH